MSVNSRITRNFQITIPKEIRKILPFLKEGDPVEFKVEDNKIVVTPQKRINADQSYYWSSQWQKEIAEAKNDLKTGNSMGPYDDIEEALSDLKKPFKGKK